MEGFALYFLLTAVASYRFGPQQLSNVELRAIAPAGGASGPIVTLPERCINICAKSSCQSTTGCNYGYPCDCSRYVHCPKSSISNETQLLSCKQGWLWNDAINGCSLNSRCVSLIKPVPVDPHYPGSISQGSNGRAEFCESIPELPQFAEWTNDPPSAVPSGDYLRFRCTNDHVLLGYSAVLCFHWKFLPISGTCVQDISATNTVIISYSKTIYNVFIFYFQVTSSFGQPKGTVEISSPQYGVFGSAALSSIDGKGNYEFTLPSPGNYTIEIIYKGNGEYLGSIDTQEITVIEAKCVTTPDVTFPVNVGTCHGNVVSRSTCTLGCDTAYESSGSLGVTCFNGQWSNATGSCIAKSTRKWKKLL